MDCLLDIFFTRYTSVLTGTRPSQSAPHDEPNASVDRDYQSWGRARSTSGVTFANSIAVDGAALFPLVVKATHRRSGLLHWGPTGQNNESPFCDYLARAAPAD